MWKITLYVLIVLAVFAGGFYLYLVSNFGKMPSAEDEAKYAKLPYYRNGQFQSPKELFYDFSKTTGGKVGFGRFLFKSEYAPKKPYPKEMLDKSSFSEKPSGYALYWLGHSAAILDLDGKRFIFDPVLGNAAPIPIAVKRYDKAPIKRKNLPPVDFIVITHNHYDHLEKKTVLSIKMGHFIVPLGLGAVLRGWGIEADRITELGWGDSYEKDGFKIIAEEGIHYSNRRTSDRNKTLWASYIIRSPQKNILWGGDTGYGEHFARFGKDYGPFDLAALEIDGWNAGWPNTHMFPQEVVQAAIDAKAKEILPVHWGVFDLALHPWHESVDMVLEHAEGTGIKVLTPKIGERISKDSKTSYWWKGLK